MGEAKRRAIKRAAQDAFSRPIKRARFDLYALGTRMSWTRILSEERSHWSDVEERVLGTVIRDTHDDDYGWILLARDKIGRFRCADLETSLSSERVAVERLRERIAKAVDDGDFLALGDQGDETTRLTCSPCQRKPGPRDCIHTSDS
jgi:hypothetical protein